MNLKATLQKFQPFCVQVAKTITSTPEARSIPSIAFSREGFEYSVHLFSDEAKVYRGILKTIEDESKGLISKGRIEEVLQVAILKVISPESDQSDAAIDQRAKDAIEVVQKALSETPKAWQCCIPITGMNAPSEDWIIGAVRITHTNSPAVGNFFSLADSINDRAKADDTQKKWHKEDNRKDIISTDGTPQPVALTTIDALDATAAWDLAQRRTRFTLDCASFALNAAVPIDMFFHVSDAPPSRHYRVGLIIDISKQEMLQKQHALAGPFLFNYESFRTTSADTPWVKPLFDLLSLADPNEHQMRILNAVHWAGRALTRQTMEERFLFQAIALESLMLSRNEGEITNRLALCVVHLLGDWLRDRAGCFRDIKRLYSVRSKIVHSGVYEVQPADVSSIRVYLQGCIDRLLTDTRFAQMAKEQDLDDWLWCAMRGEKVG